jgi:hypothetical protein
MVFYNESKAIRKENLREVQDHKEKRPHNGHLRESEAQAETGLRALYGQNDRKSKYS